MHGERTSYKLVRSPADLTHAQTYFIMYCAERLDRDLNEIVGNIETKHAGKTPLDITSNDKPEDVAEKFDIITEYLCQ